MPSDDKLNEALTGFPTPPHPCSGQIFSNNFRLPKAAMRGEAPHSIPWTYLAVMQSGRNVYKRVEKTGSRVPALLAHP